MLRPEVADFVRLGPLPDSQASEERIALHQVLLQAIRKPVSDEEAAALMGSFGPDDCYGLAWSLLHVIETAPGGAPVKQDPGPEANEWVRYLWERAERGRRLKETGHI
jgi:hypothetical protein